MDSKRIYGAVSSFHMFQNLAAEHVDRIVSEIKVVQLQRGEILFNRGDVAHGFYILMEGQLKLSFTSPQGIEKIIDIIAPGKSFGEAIMFLDRPCPVAAQATLNSVLLQVQKKTLFTILQEDPAVATRMLASLSARMHHLVNSIESLSLLSGTQRLIGYILQINASSKSTTVKLPSTKSTIASLLNISPETLSRIMHKLAEEGMIAVHGKEIDILNIEGLRNYECNF
jgi:CRP-like cAMP-binding protein